MTYSCPFDKGLIQVGQKSKKENERKITLTLIVIEDKTSPELATAALLACCQDIDESDRARLSLGRIQLAPYKKGQTAAFNYPCGTQNYIVCAKCKKKTIPETQKVGVLNHLHLRICLFQAQDMICSKIAGDRGQLKSISKIRMRMLIVNLVRIIQGDILGISAS